MHLMLKKLVLSVIAMAQLFIRFLLFDPHYLDNFIYRQPRTPNQLLLHTMCTEDLYSIYHVERHLCWYECVLWTEDIQQHRVRSHVYFSEKDDLVPVSLVNEYL